MICRYRFDGLSLLQCKQGNNENASQKLVTSYLCLKLSILFLEMYLRYILIEAFSEAVHNKSGFDPLLLSADM